MLEKLKSFFAKGCRTQWCVFVLFAFTIFVKCFIFHWACFHSAQLISSLWNAPFEFFRFWGEKLLPALFIASFVFLCRKNWWTIIANVIIDLWLIANMFYYKANSLFLSWETMQMADNMTGFWDSLYAYLGWDIYIYAIITTLYVVCYIPLRHVNNRNILAFTCFFVLSIFLSFFDNFCHAKTIKKLDPNLAEELFRYYCPFEQVAYFSQKGIWVDYNKWANVYINEYSIISYFPAMFIFNMLRPAGEIIVLSDDEISQIEPFVSAHNTPQTPKTNLVFVLVESLESWPIKEVCGYKYMPFLSSLIENEHVLYGENVKPQVKHGNSADGQMIDVTGILPIADGATCRLYADNKFPGYAECYKNAAIVNPSPGMWGQSKVTFSYQFKELIEPSKGEGWADKEIIEKVKQYADTSSNTFCVLGITITSHVPFTHGFKYPKHTIDEMPHSMSAYLNCLSYCDSCIGTLFDAVFSNERLKDNTTIVISGDHTIFRNTNKEINDFADKNGISLQTTYMPLIVYSPQIKENIQITDTCYQMDIYPTIMTVIGCADYYWKGLGVNLLDSIARQNRPISEQDAFILSDKLIRSNYFDTLKH